MLNFNDTQKSFELNSLENENKTNSLQEKKNVWKIKARSLKA